MTPTLKATKPSTLSGEENVSNGTIHVKVLRAVSLPTLDFGKRQEPYIQVELEGSMPKSWGSTDPSFQGFPNSEWTTDQNREIELFYDANLHTRDAVLTFEVYSNESNDDLIGIGQIDVFSIAQSQTAVEKEIIVRLKESLSGTASRGELVVTVWFGPPVRKAFRAAQRMGKLLDARDSVVASLWSMGLHAATPLSKYLQGPTDYLKKNRKVSMVLAAGVGILSAGLAVIFMMIAVPTATIAAFTFPFWIIPFLIASFFTAPLWLPIVLLVGLFLTFIMALFVGLGVTSRPVRRKGAQLSSRIKQSDVGKRVVYEKSA